MSQKKIFQKGYYSSNKKCPKCGYDLFEKWYTVRYISENDSMEYQCFGCRFEFIEYLNEEKIFDQDIEISEEIETISSNVFLNKIDDLYKKMDKQNNEIIKLKEKIQLLLKKETNISNYQQDEKVFLDDLDNFKI